MLYKNLAYCIFKNTINLGNILDYFISNTENLWVYVYPSSGKNSPTIFKHYIRGKLANEHKVFLYRGNSKLLIMLFYNIYYIYFLCFYKIKKAYIMVNYPIFTFFSATLRILFSNETILRVGDYFPDRKGLIYIYSCILNHCIRKSKYLIFSSQKLYETYNKEIQFRTDQTIRIITLGITGKKVERNPQEKLLGFLGNLREGQGLELILSFLQAHRDYKLEVIGEGVLKAFLLRKIKEKRLENQVKVLGFVADEDLESIVSHWQMALALYDPSPRNLTFYTEPSKVKLYVQFEIPVIMTRVTYLHKELIEYNAGYVVENNASDLFGAVDGILEIHMKILRRELGV